MHFRLMRARQAESNLSCRLLPTEESCALTRTEIRSGICRHATRRRGKRQN